jgi:hypothetical protein
LALGIPEIWYFSTLKNIFSGKTYWVFFKTDELLLLVSLRTLVFFSLNLVFFGTETSGPGHPWLWPQSPATLGPSSQPWRFSHEQNIGVSQSMCSQPARWSANVQPSSSMNSRCAANSILSSTWPQSPATLGLIFFGTDTPGPGPRAQGPCSTGVSIPRVSRAFPSCFPNDPGIFQTEFSFFRY